MVGQAVVAEGRLRGFSVVESTREDCDLGCAQAISRRVREVAPRWVFNCAATTDVDGAEGTPAPAFAINGTAVGVLAEVCRETGSKLVHLSSDYVFDGARRVPYVEDDETSPISQYGRSKLAGESAALAVSTSLVVRTSWLFGVGGRNFVSTIAGLLAADDPSDLGVVDDQRGCPTSSRSLARALWDLVVVGATGVVHYCDRGPVTWYGFAREIARRTSGRRRVVAVVSAGFPRPAPRPAYSVLATDRFVRLTGREPEAWLDGLTEYLGVLSGEDR